MTPPAEVLESRDVRKTYRYLRIGMIGAVVLLAASIGIERSGTDCWQTSVSAYYYTPVRAIFVGAMIAVGLALIVYRGRGWVEDVSLNIAGMLAPVVAVAPTTDTGTCWSIEPMPLPKTPDGELATWVTTNIDNNISALLIAGGAGLAVALVIAVVVQLSPRWRLDWEAGTWISLVVTGVVLVLGWWAQRYWSSFDTRAHGFAAVAMFVALIVVIAAKAVGHRGELGRPWFWWYAVIATTMTVGGVVIWRTRIFGDHTVFALEAFEISLFALYWGIQTVENWNEPVVATTSTPEAGSDQPPLPPPAPDAVHVTT